MVLALPKIAVSPSYSLRSDKALRQVFPTGGGGRQSPLVKTCTTMAVVDNREKRL